MSIDNLIYSYYTNVALGTFMYLYFKNMDRMSVDVVKESIVISLGMPFVLPYHAYAEAEKYLEKSMK